MKLRVPAIDVVVMLRNGAEVLGAGRSAAYLLFTFLGGSTYFFGPIIGAVLMVLAYALFSEVTKAWLLYLGLIFMLMVMYAPGGVASLIMVNARLASQGKLKPLLGSYALLALCLVLALSGTSAIIEMVYRLQLSASDGDVLNYLGLSLNVQALQSWAAAGACMVMGFILFELVRRRFARQWKTVQSTVELHGSSEEHA